LNNNRITVADSLLAELARIGADTIFGIISIHNIPFFDALQRRGGFRVVSARHEGAAVNMADAYARISGKLGVALTSTGTGAGNAAGALIEAWNGGAPLLHITGQVASHVTDTGRGYIHDSKGQFGMLESISKRAHRVQRAEQAPALFRGAIEEALRPPSGPVSIEIPIDFQAALVPVPSISTPPLMPAIPSDGELQMAVDRILASQRPILWLGSGAMMSDAAPEIRELLETLDAAVITTQSGRGIVPETDLRVLGHFATYPKLKEWIATGDLLISVGVRFRGNETSNWSIKTPADHIGIDADPAAINRNFLHSVGLVGDAKATLAAINRLLKDHPTASRHPSFKRRGDSSQYVEEIGRLRETLRSDLRDTLGPWEGILDTIRQVMPEDAILVRDVTVPATVWGARLIERRYPRTSLHASAGGIGQGLPMAIGAQIASPSKSVVLLAGDGGLLLNIGEMAVARHESLPVVVVLFDDNGYGVLRNIQDANFEGRTIGVDMHSPDFVAIATAFGFGSRRVRSAAEFRKAFADAIESRAPWMVVIDSDSIGPMKKIFAGPDGGAQLYKPH
jgi:acetolactate synthase-1/2/3 large subunit